MFFFSPIALVVGGEGEEGHPRPMAENVVPPAAALDGTAPLRGLDQAGQLKGREAATFGSAPTWRGWSPDTY